MTNRKSSSGVSSDERARFISVMSQLIAAPGDPNAYGSHVAYHHGHHGYEIHPGVGTNGTQRFLAWHRLYLLKTEQMAQQIDPAFFIPYWDWRVDRDVPDWMKNFKPTIKVPGTDIVVVRNPPSGNLPTAEAINGVNSAATFTAFTLRMDPLHGRVHDWCNGTMSDFNNSPADPLFWMHHAFIDKLWSEWPPGHAGEVPNPTSAGRVLTPFAEAVTEVLDIATLGYRYV